MGRRKTYSAEQIIMKLREADVLIAQGMTVHELCRVLKIILIKRFQPAHLKDLTHH